MIDPGMQHTLARDASLQGVGFLSGKAVRVTFCPAPAGSGIVFVRTGCSEPVRIPADIRHLRPTPRRTTLAVGDVSVEMVEHVLGALAGLGIDNCEVHLNAAELPGGDGSAGHFVDCLLQAGLAAQDRRRRVLVLDRALHVSDGAAHITAAPYSDETMLLSYHLDYGSASPIVQQSRCFPLPSPDFTQQLATARTFLLEQEAHQLRAQGLGTTVGPKDLLIFAEDGPIDNTLRFPDEPVRHKLLDMVGDLALLGCPLAGHVSGYRSGHRLNARMVERLVEVFGNARAETVRIDTKQLQDAPAKRDDASQHAPPSRAKSSRQPLRVGVVGVGHMGKHHARILASMPDVELVGVADVSAPNVEAVAGQWNVPGYRDFRELFGRVDAVTVAVPTVHHATVAREFLRNGIAVLVEKPLCGTVAEADELLALSSRHAALVQVGHSERFNPAFVAAAQHVDAPKFIQVDRLGPYAHRSTDIGVVLDLMVHDLDLILALTCGQVKRVDALGISVFGQHEDIANARIVFEDGCIACLNASRASRSPRRRMQIWSASGYADIDFAARTVELLRCAIRQGRDVPADRGDATGEWTPVEATSQWPVSIERHQLTPAPAEPLAEQLRQFVDCVRNGQTPWVDGRRGRDAVVLADRVLQRIARHPWEGDPNGLTGPHLLQGSIVPGPHWHLQPVPTREQRMR